MVAFTGPLYCWGAQHKEPKEIKGRAYLVGVKNMVYMICPECWRLSTKIRQLLIR